MTQEDPDPTWRDRQAYWQRKVRPIRLGAEPVRAQLSRRFHGSIVITVITASIGLMILAIFAAFGRVDVGGWVFGLGFLPFMLWYWLDYALLRARASAYLEEWAARNKSDAPPG